MKQHARREPISRESNDMDTNYPGSKRIFELVVVGDSSGNAAGPGRQGGIKELPEWRLS